ncbi:MAG: hypothetical protein H0W50_11585 [Parachlamydiaceae bacterium]|nr:hypothetical protein [Parachlamydiaceae bacterium]
MRTQNLKDFSKDLFLPTFFNFALKVNIAAQKVFASIFAIALDVLTFPIRFFATPYCLYLNWRHPEIHSLTHLIGQYPGPDVVNLVYEVQNVQVADSYTENGDTFQNATKAAIKGVMSVALKRIPGGIKSCTSETEENISYICMNGEWMQVKKTSVEHPNPTLAI